MLLMSRRRTITVSDSKKQKRCNSCKRSNSAKPSKKCTNNSLIEDPKKAHNTPTAPPQSLKKPENLDSEIHFPEPPSSFATGPATNNEMDFDELARRFDELKKKP